MTTLSDRNTTFLATVVELASSTAGDPRDVQAVVFSPPETFVPNSVLSVLVSVIDVWINLLICIMGVVTNTINIIVFCRLGFKDTVNITMTTISAWDLVKVLCGMVHRFFGPVSLVSPALGKSWENITFTKLTYIHVISGNVSAVIAGYVAVERCLCVSLPFTVKTLLTPKLTFALSAVLSVVVFFSYFCILLIFDIRWVYSSAYATEIAVYVYNSFYRTHGQVFFKAYTWFHFIYPFLSLVAMVSSTIIIAYHLARASRFKKTALRIFRTETPCKTGPPRSDITAETHSRQRQIFPDWVSKKVRGQVSMTSKEKQVVKMLLVVIAVFIANQGPRFIHVFAMILVPEYYPLKSYHNLIMCVMCFVSFLDFLNASVSLFIFLPMSSNFRTAFLQIFRVKYSKS